ncbi:SCO family protein [Propionivibrio dicarboxylicus]|uniref:Protein SCO1/2 n=1 Tax=Propionivibrio dicarboxylicus TaxID=83767 RepID=A0A1G8JEI7_9RHOO|nr:SCO family protein [Propionivibrio dicarboxylicus]SDI29668.1 protein SCO1/2 [Propionivibrio dicarboxylicus]
MTQRPFWLALTLALAALLVWLAFFWQPMPDSAASPTAPTSADLPRGGNFRLDSADGPVALADFRGKVVALYFGYTFCPDVCPTALVGLAQAFAQLTPAELERVKGLFITVDPERDTLDVLKVYVPYFHPSITGLRGTPEEIARTAALYDVRYMKQKGDGSGPYPVDHSSFTYLVAPDGRLAARLAHGTPPEVIVDKIRALLKP